MNKASDWAEREAKEIISELLKDHIGKDKAGVFCGAVGWRVVALALTKAELRGYERGMEEAAKESLGFRVNDTALQYKYAELNDLCIHIATAIRSIIKRGREGGA